MECCLKKLYILPRVYTETLWNNIVSTWERLSWTVSTVRNILYLASENVSWPTQKVPVNLIELYFDNLWQISFLSYIGNETCHFLFYGVNVHISLVLATISQEKLDVPMLFRLPHIFQLFPNRNHFPPLFSREPPRMNGKGKKQPNGYEWRATRDEDDETKGWEGGGGERKKRESNRKTGKRVSRDNTFLSFVDNYTQNTNQGSGGERERERKLVAQQTTPPRTMSFPPSVQINLQLFRGVVFHRKSPDTRFQIEEQSSGIYLSTDRTPPFALKGDETCPLCHMGNLVNTFPGGMFEMTVARARYYFRVNIILHFVNNC